MTVRYIPEITVIVFELLAVDNDKHKEKNLIVANSETNLI